MAKSKIELSVEGMTGEGVCHSIEAGLSEIEGVEYVHVNLGAGKITVEYDDSVTAADRLVDVVRQMGFYPVQL